MAVPSYSTSTHFLNFSPPQVNIKKTINRYGVADLLASDDQERENLLTWKLLNADGNVTISVQVFAQSKLQLLGMMLMPFEYSWRKSHHKKKNIDFPAQQLS